MDGNIAYRRPSATTPPYLAEYVASSVPVTVRSAPSVDEAWQVLLVQTDDPARAGKWALPGVLVRDDETFDAAARRALRTKAGLDAAGWYLDQLGTFGDPGRDTRGRVVSVAHVALERSDAFSSRRSWRIPCSARESLHASTKLITGPT